MFQQRFTFIIFLFLLLFSAGCAIYPSEPLPTSSDKPSPIDNPVQNNLGKDNFLPITPFTDPIPPSDPYELRSVSLQGDILTVEVSYSGGCKEHEFTVVWGGSIMETYPVKTGLWLSHESNNDLCKAMIVRRFSVDLTPIKEKQFTLYRRYDLIKMDIGYEQGWKLFDYTPS